MLRTTRIDERDADHRPRAAEDAHAAEQDDRDDVELEAGRQVAADRAEPRREQHAGKAREEARRGQQQHLVARHVQARVASDARAVADHEHPTAERRPVQHDPGDEDQRHEEDHGERDAPDHRLLAEVLEPLGEVADRAVLDEDAPGAAPADQARRA